MSDLPGVFITTPEFLPQRAQRERTLQLTAAEARGQQRLAEANRTVLTTSTPSSPHSKPTSRNLPKIRPDNSIHPATAAQKRHENTRIKAIAAPHDLDQAGAPINFAAVAEHAGAIGTGALSLITADTA